MDRGLYQKGIIIVLLSALLPMCGSGVWAQDISWKDSLDVLRKRIDVEPYSSDLHLKKAAVNLQLKQWDYAISEYNLVLEKDPHHLAAFFYRAYAQKNLRRYDLARQDYEEVLKRVPGHYEARLCLAQICQLTGKMTEAVDHLNRLVELAPDSAEAYVARAGGEQELKQTDAALYDWDQAIRLCPDNLDYQLSKLRLLQRTKRKREAGKMMRELERKGINRRVFE